MVEDRRGGQGAGQDLAGHHPRQGNDAHADHGVQGRQKGGLHGLFDKGQEDHLRVSPDAHQGVDLPPLAIQAFPEGFHPQGNPGHGIAHDHPGNGDDILGIENTFPHHNINEKQDDQDSGE